MRDVGTLGERTFDMWCSQTDLLCNDSKRIDKTGWDFIVEFPSDHSEESISKPAFECKIQVKATDGKKNSWSIKLSNLRRLCTSTLPTFIVLLKYDNKDNPVKALIRHVDEELIREVLAKIYQLKRNSKKLELHKTSHAVTFDNSHQLEELNGHCLRNKLIKFIGTDLRKYAREKELQVIRAESHMNSKKINVFSKGEENLDKFINSVLGKNEVIIASEVTIEETPFELVNDNQLTRYKDALIKISNVTPTQGQIKFRKDRFSPAVLFPVKLYGNPLYKDLPPHLRKHRIESDYFSIEINPDLKTAEYTFSFEKIKRLEVKQFLNILNFYDGITSTENSPTLEIKTSNTEALTINVNPIEKDIDYTKEIETLKRLIKILNHFERYDDIYITYSEITRLETSTKQFTQLISSQYAFMVKIELEEKFLAEDKEYIHLMPFYVRINDIVLAQLTSFKGHGKIEGQQVTMENPKIIFEKQFNLTMDGSYNADRIKEEIKTEMHNLAKKYDDDYNVILSNLK